MAAPAAAVAQGQVRREVGVDLVGVASRPGQLLAGASLWSRVGSRTRLGGLGALGGAGGEPAVRLEFAGHFLLSPRATRGVSLYGGGGLAFSRGEARGEHLLVVVGLESRAGAQRGWIVEAGLGGGARLLVGWRWRRA